MNTRRYKIGELIHNEHGLELRVQEIDCPSLTTIGKTDSCYKTVCTKCGYIFEMVAKNLESKKACHRCIARDGVHKFDANGHCISINGIEPMAYFNDFRTTHDLDYDEALGLLYKAMDNAKKPVNEE